MEKAYLSYILTPKTHSKIEHMNAYTGLYLNDLEISLFLIVQLNEFSHLEFPDRC